MTDGHAAAIPPIAPGAWPADLVERRRVDTLIPYARNARTHSDEQVAQIAASIREWGWTVPVLVDEDDVLIAGHGRILAAERLGLAEAPTTVARGWTDAQKRAYRIADNKLALNAGWDEDFLRIELASLRDDPTFDLDLVGFSNSEIADILADRTEGRTDPDEVPPVPEEAISAPGDLWILGQHRLLCGSSLVEADVRRLMAGERAMLFATDPPYAVGYQGGSHPATAANRAKANRDKNWSAIYRDADINDIGLEFYETFIRIACAEAIEQTAAWYCWHASVRAAMVEQAWEANGAFIHQQIIWAKSRAVLTYSLFMWQHEPCHFGWRRSYKPPGNVHSDGVDFTSTLWVVPNNQVESKDHPTCKPVKLFSVPMQIHTQAGELCYEPFSGSGTQIMAAETMNRRCYAMEIQPVFVDVAVLRWQAFTGKEVVLDGDGRTFDQIAAERQSPDQTRHQQ